MHNSGHRKHCILLENLSTEAFNLDSSLKFAEFFESDSMNKISLKSVNCADQITSYFIKKRLLLTGFNSTPNELLFGKLKPTQTTKSDKKTESNTKPFEIQPNQIDINTSISNIVSQAEQSDNIKKKRFYINLSIQ